jgi:thiol-disulfide isomerase/thioredoxin
VIGKKDCPDCFDINLLVKAIKQNNLPDKVLQEAANAENAEEAMNKAIDAEKNVKVQIVEFDSDAGKKLIEQYKITAVPTILVGGELEENARLSGYWQSLGEVIDGVFVLRQVIPPYIDLSDNDLKGEKHKIFYCRDNIILSTLDGYVPRFAA